MTFAGKGSLGTAEIRIGAVRGIGPKLRLRGVCGGVCSVGAGVSLDAFVVGIEPRGLDSDSDRRGLETLNFRKEFPMDESIDVVRGLVVYASVFAGISAILDGP